MRAFVIFVVALCAFAAVASASQSVHVKLHVFAGTRDPEWRLHPEEAAEFLNSFGNEIVDSDLYSGRMGYTGFSVTVYNRNFRIRTKHVYGQQDAELFLLNSAAKHHVVAENVLEHAKSEIAAFSTRPATSFIQKPSHHRFALNKCTAPVVGPDNETDYAPQTDNCGFYETYQSDNNCYDYGTDIATNTFAQPGRGSGHKWTANTCDAISKAAESDGLTWNGTQLPTHQPPAGGHYMALYIWPDTNFHWARWDSNTHTWSHKPGGTPIRNTDNNGNTITDPSKADLSPWSQFCGYMIVVPSRVCTSNSHCIN